MFEHAIALYCAYLKDSTSPEKKERPKMYISEIDAQKVISKARTIVAIVEVNRLSDRASVLKMLNDAVKNRHTIIVVKQ